MYTSVPEREKGRRNREIGEDQRRRGKERGRDGAQGRDKTAGFSNPLFPSPAEGNGSGKGTLPLNRICGFPGTSFQEEVTLSHHLPSNPKKALLCLSAHLGPPQALEDSALPTKTCPGCLRPVVGPQGHRLSPSRSHFNHQVALQLHRALPAVGLGRAPGKPALPAGPSGPHSLGTLV